MKIQKNAMMVVAAVLTICLVCTIPAFAASDYPGNDGFTSGKPLLENGASGENDMIPDEVENETMPYVPETRSQKEQESISELMESLDALYGNEERDNKGTGTVNVILRDETDEDSVLLVLYDEYKTRRELLISRNSSYTCSAVLPAGKYNVIGAYPVSEDSESKFYTNTDNFELSQSGSYLVEIGVVERESMSIPDTVPELKETEASSEAAAEPPAEVSQKEHKLLWVIALSILMGGAILTVCIKKNKR